jgi:hypothetical protein
MASGVEETGSCTGTGLAVCLYWVVLGCTGLYWVVLGPVLGCTGFCTGLCTGLYWVVLGCAGFCTGLYWVVLGCTGFCTGWLGGSMRTQLLPLATLVREEAIQFV